MTWYIRANALSLEDGTMNITYFEGEDGFDITGEDAPVYTFALALWIKEWNDGAYDYISFRTTRGPAIIQMRGMWIRKIKSDRSHGTQHSPVVWTAKAH